MGWLGLLQQFKKSNGFSAPKIPLSTIQSIAGNQAKVKPSLTQWGPKIYRFVLRECNAMDLFKVAFSQKVYWGSKEYAKSRPWAEYLNFPPIIVNNLFKLSAQESDLEYFFEPHRTFWKKATFILCEKWVNFKLSKHYLTLIVLNKRNHIIFPTVEM